MKRNRNTNSSEEFDALKNISLHITDGDRVGIIGLNGAGKSSLLKMIAGIYPPHAGIVRVEGKVTSLIELGTGFDLELSGRENIYLNGTLLGQSYREMKQLESEIIEFSELDDAIAMPLKYYSSGMYGRLAFSIVAALKPEILIADEIFATGDEYFVTKSLERMKQMFRDSKIILLVSHNLDEIVELCNKVVVLHRGEIFGLGASEEMVELYRTNIVEPLKRQHSEDTAAAPQMFSISDFQQSTTHGVSIDGN